MLEYDERIARPEKRRVRGANRDGESGRVRRVQMAVGAPNERQSIAEEEPADSLACDLLMERLDAPGDARFVPEII